MHRLPSPRTTMCRLPSPCMTMCRLLVRTRPWVDPESTCNHATMQGVHVDPGNLGHLCLIKSTTTLLRPFSSSAFYAWVGPHSTMCRVQTPTLPIIYLGWPHRLGHTILCVVCMPWFSRALPTTFANMPQPNQPTSRIDYHLVMIPKWPGVCTWTIPKARCQNLRALRLGVQIWTQVILHDQHLNFH